MLALKTAGVFSASTTALMQFDTLGWLIAAELSDATPF